MSQIVWMHTANKENSSWPTYCRMTSCCMSAPRHLSACSQARSCNSIALNKLLRETFGPEPSGAYLQAKAFPHDLGAYWEVVCHFNPDVPDSIEYALRLEREAPTTWGSDGAASERCPECGGEFELGSAVQLCSFMQGEDFRCRACKVIFAHDLTVLARPMG